MLALFLLGSVWFWGLTLIAVISITALIENEFNFWADVTFFATLFILYKFGCGESITSMFLWICAHPIYTILIFLGYLVVGTGYSLLKWAIFVSDGKARLLKRGNNYYAPEWKPGRHKAKIIHWMTYWPISGAWTLLSNPVTRAVNRIFNKLEVVYQKISDRIMKDLILKKNEQS